MEYNETIAHISCQRCGKIWQVLNDEGIDWDEEKTADLYNSESHSCGDPEGNK